MECYRIDESGYTGFDLLNGEQRFQGATAVAISDADATLLIKEHFPRLQAAELNIARWRGDLPTTRGSSDCWATFFAPSSP